MLLQKIKRAAWFLIVAVCVLGAIGAMLAVRPLRFAPDLPDSSLLASTSFNAKDAIAEVEVVSERPLFWSGRKPYVEAVKPKPKPKPAPKNNALKDVEVVGVFAAGASSSVVLKPKKGDVTRVALDGLYQGWRLVDVTPAGAMFALDGGKRQAQPRVQEIRLNKRDPLPTQWQGKKQNLSESQ
jgi:hypothetical protein